MIFVDTGAWFALTVPGDRDHDAANEWLQTNNQSLLTTDYVVSETLTLFRARGQYKSAIDMGKGLLSGKFASIEHVTTRDFESAWQIFKRFDDKDWSFTDCTSRVVMQRLGIQTAFAFDDDFRQFGTVEVVPQIAA